MADENSEAPRVLIVEDEWLIAQDLADKLDGYVIVGPAPSAARALALVAQEAVDIALLDIRLGEDDSLPIARALRERDIPFAFLTGYSKQQLPAGFGSQMLLNKPILRETLLSAVSSLLQARAA